MQGRQHEDWHTGERAAVVKHQDNLKMEGAFSGRVEEKWQEAERANVVKYEDNLKLEGKKLKLPS